MNKLLIATAAVAFATVGTAGAADLPTKAPPMVAAAPVQTWTGCYVSGGIGYGMWNQDVSGTENLLNANGGVVGTLNTATTTDGGRGWLGRVGVGCDYQFAQQFLFGAFADWDWSNIKGTNLPNEFAIIGGFTSPVAYNVKERNAGNVGLRLGYLPYPNLLTFVSGGWTRARFDEGVEFLTATGASVSGLTYPSSYDVNGWFIGGGTEYRLPWWQGLTWKTEYRFNQYQTINLAETFGGVPTGNVVHNQSFVQTVTTSLVWRFNWGGPVVARY
jgi:outer membrane immunogenic protein